jgi:uncharacterized heparinase superfamily protein
VTQYGGKDAIQKSDLTAIAMNNSQSVTVTAPASISGLIDLGARRLCGKVARRFAGGVTVPVSCRAKGLGVTISPLIPGDVARASALYRGRFEFGMTAIECSGRIVFEHQVADAQWTAELHGFSWLGDLRAGDRELYRVQARALVQDWIARRKALDERAWRSRTAARRLISWVIHAGFLLESAPEDFRHVFLSQLGRQARRMIRIMARENDRRARLDAAIALTYACLGISGLESLRSLAYGRLARELSVQVLADGGHISRSPLVLLDVLADLLPLRRALDEVRLEVPAELNEALERMMPMLRFFRHADGGLAVFNGVHDEARLRAEAVCNADEVGGRPLVHALHTGYCRLAHGPASVVIDTGRPPAPGYNEAAGSGPLAFEFSDGPHRIVVNCGTPSTGNDAWSDVARLTAAHSTVSLGERSAGHVMAGRLMRRVFGTPVILGPQDIGGEVRSVQNGSVLEAEHDGYVATYGLSHSRRLFLSGDGKDLRGEDRFRLNLDGDFEMGSVAFAARFHIHPSVRVTMSQDSASVMLMLPDKSGWRFSAKGGRLKLEDSVYLPGEGGAKRCKQIVIEGVVGRPDRVQWAFKRIEKRKTTGQPQAQQAPELPL